jgi:cellobiose transport system substrate-binding protein
MLNSRPSTSAVWRLLALAAVLALCVLAAGCGGDDESNASADGGGDTGSATASAEPVTLNVGLFGTFGYKEAGLYDEYMAEHPNVTIKETSVEQEGEYYQALQTRLAANSGLADIQGIEVGRIAEVTQLQGDKWVDLNTLGADELADTFFDWKWQAAQTADGKVLGLGTDTGPLAICYRRDLFEKAGLTSDRDELAQQWGSWEDYLDFGREYVAKAKHPFMDSSGGLYNAILGQSELQYYDEDGNPIYDSNPAVKEAWDLAATAAEEGLTAKLKQFDTAWNQGFANGAFATIACPAWMIGYIKGQAGDEASGQWDVALIPGDGGNWGGSYLSIPAASEHPQEAYDLIKWLTAPEQQIKMWTTAQHFPSSSTAAADPDVESATDDYFSGAPIGELFKQSADSLPVAILGQKDGTIKDTITNGLLLIEQQGDDPDTAWEKTLDDIQNAIE